MCGIVGYVGHRDATDFLIEGRRRLEYRGYDSAGVATLSDRANLATVKAVMTNQDQDVMATGQAEILLPTP